MVPSENVSSVFFAGARQTVVILYSPTDLIITHLINLRITENLTYNSQHSFWFTLGEKTDIHKYHY